MIVFNAVFLFRLNRAYNKIMSHTFWMRVGGIDVQIIIILRHTKIA